MAEESIAKNKVGALAHAFVEKNEEALCAAALDTLETFMVNQERIADALERIAEACEARL